MVCYNVNHCYISYLYFSRKEEIPLQIAICDDEEHFRNGLREKLLGYKRKKRIAMDIYEFEDGGSLLNSETVFDMILLDYQLPDVNGMEIAKELRLRNAACSIIFVTQYPQFVYDAFEVQPFRFFVKPVSEEKLFSALDTFLENNKHLSPIVIVYEGQQVTIDAKSIIYLEGDGKYCLVRTTDNTYRSSQTLSQVQSLLPAHCFYRIHKSYVVNMYYISSLQGSELILINGEKASVGRTRLSDFRKSYMDFVRDHYVRL